MTLLFHVETKLTLFIQFYAGSFLFVPKLFSCKSHLLILTQRFSLEWRLIIRSMTIPNCMVNINDSRVARRRAIIK